MMIATIALLACYALMLWPLYHFSMIECDKCQALKWCQRGRVFTTTKPCRTFFPTAADRRRIRLLERHDLCLRSLLVLFILVTGSILLIFVARALHVPLPYDTLSGL
jgi:hypothetical protein